MSYCLNPNCPNPQNQPNTKFCHTCGSKLLLKDRFYAIKLIGEGGFGKTFQGVDIHMPSGRHCAIKQLKPMTDDPQVYELVKERFGREAVILEDLGGCDPQIPGLYAYFESGGQFYLVQEWISGVTLTTKVQTEGILTESSVREILTGILSVLDRVHSKRIVHRDIKPDNIILRGSNNQPVLIDFGAVKESMGTVLTPSGNSNRSIVVGTPGFMPSEQTAGRPVYASDLYSLGLTAVYLLTGKFPGELQTDPATGEILWGQYAKSVSPTLAQILDKAIQSHPRERYTTAAEMLHALSPATTEILAPTPPPSTPPLANPSSGMGLRDWQKAVITGSAIGTFLVAALLLNKYLRQQPSTSLTTTSQSTSTTTTEPTTTEPTSSTDVLPPTASITETDAVNLIQKWQSYKRRIFSPPYESYLGDELLTGKAYRDNIRRVDGQQSSVEWLKNNRAYYTYGVQSIDSTESFASSENEATIDLVVTEERTLYNNKGSIDRNASGFDKRLVRYTLQFENGQWKIADYQTVKIFWKK